MEPTIDEFVPNWSMPLVVRALQALLGVELIVAVAVGPVIDLVDLRNSHALYVNLCGTLSKWHSIGRLS